MNDYQRDECYSYLQLLNANVAASDHNEHRSSNTNLVHTQMYSEDGLSD